MAGALLVGFGRGHHADVVQEAVPEPAVQQMQRGVLHAAVVPVHRQPVLQLLHGGQFLVVVGVDSSAGNTSCEPAHWGMVSVSRLAGPPHLGQVVLTQSVIAASGAFAVVGGLVAFHLGQRHGQLILRARGTQPQWSQCTSGIGSPQ